MLFFQFVSLKHICQSFDRFAQEATHMSTTSEKLIGDAIDDVLFGREMFR